MAAPLALVWVGFDPIHPVVVVLAACPTNIGKVVVELGEEFSDLAHYAGGLG